MDKQTVTVIREVTIVEYGAGGAVGVPKEVAAQFGLEVGKKVEWFAIQVGGLKVLGLRPCAEIN